MKAWVKKLATHRFGNGRYSQSYQDELIRYVFQNVKPVNSPPFCVEFGFNASELTAGSGANVARCILEDGWTGLLLDGEHENPDINLYRHFLTSRNIVEVFKSHNVPQEPDYVSIDIDSTDLWLFKELIREYRAIVYSVEYNSSIPLDYAITFPNDPSMHWAGDRGYGASLKALTLVAVEHGYSLLWVVPPLDAFFIRNDIIADGSDRISYPLSNWNLCTNRPVHSPVRNDSIISRFIDYEIYTQTEGDTAASTEAAFEICQRYLAGNGDAWTRVNKLRRGINRLRKKFFSFT